MSTATASFTSIPVLDLSRWTGAGTGGATDIERDRFAAELVEVAHRVGFLLLEGHGVEDAHLRRWMDAVAAFFALPDSTKAKVDKRRSPHFRGWEQVGAELTDNRVDHREQLDVCTAREPVPDADPPFLRLEGPNQWLPDDVLPGFRSLVEGHMDRMGAIADALMAAISRGLGLEDDHLRRVFGERPFSLAKLIRYPATPPGSAASTRTMTPASSRCSCSTGSAACRCSTPMATGSTCHPCPGRSSSTSARCSRR